MINGLSWLLLVVDLSSILLPGREEAEEDEEDELGPAGFFRLLFVPADSQHKIENS